MIGGAGRLYWYMSCGAGVGNQANHRRAGIHPALTRVARGPGRRGKRGRHIFKYDYFSLNRHGKAATRLAMLQRNKPISRAAQHTELALKGSVASQRCQCLKAGILYFIYQFFQLANLQNKNPLPTNYPPVQIQTGLVGNTGVRRTPGAPP